MRSQIISLCHDLGQDPLLVQGAGGNVSWKDGNTLWIKASGTWIAEAGSRDIFVPVALDAYHHAFLSNNFDPEPKLLNSITLRPSIETAIHALLPHPVVVHLHAVEALAYLVRKNFELELESALPESLNWASVPYAKPGHELAYRVHQVVEKNSKIQVLFLQNHGIVVSGQNPEQIHETLTLALGHLRRKKSRNFVIQQNLPVIEKLQPIALEHLHELAFDAGFFQVIQSSWVLYPDHVVFLGPKAFVFESMDDLNSYLTANSTTPDLVFVRNQGVFTNPQFSEAKLAQLSCYWEVLSRQDSIERLNPLSDQDIAALLNWDAEKYRIDLSFARK